MASARVRRFAGCSPAPGRGARAVRVGSPPPTRMRRFFPARTTVVSMRWSGPRAESAATAVASLTVEAGVTALPCPSPKTSRPAATSRTDALRSGPSAGSLSSGASASASPASVGAGAAPRPAGPGARPPSAGSTGGALGAGRGPGRDARHWHRPWRPPPPAPPYADPSPTGRTPPPRRSRPRGRWLRRPPSAARSAGYGAVWRAMPAAWRRPPSVPTGPPHGKPTARTVPPTAI